MWWRTTLRWIWSSTTRSQEPRSSSVSLDLKVAETRWCSITVLHVARSPSNVRRFPKTLILRGMMMNHTPLNRPWNLEEIHVQVLAVARSLLNVACLYIDKCFSVTMWSSKLDFEHAITGRTYWQGIYRGWKNAMTLPWTNQKNSCVLFVDAR